MMRTMTETERNKELTRAFIAAIARGDTDTIVATYADDGRLATMGRTLISGVYTRDQIAAMAGQVLAAFPQGLEFTIHSMVAEGDRVAVEAESRGPHASGRLWRDGRLVELKEYMDTELVTDILCGGQRPAAAASP